MNDLTLLRREYTLDTQKVVPFTGEGAYHGSTRRRTSTKAARAPQPVVDEMAPKTLESYPADGSRPIAEFEATFPNVYVIERVLPVPTQEEVRTDGVVFCWCPLDEAISEAGPLTKRMLEAMKELIVGDKRYVYEGVYQDLPAIRTSPPAPLPSASRRGEGSFKYGTRLFSPSPPRFTRGRGGQGVRRKKAAIS